MNWHRQYKLPTVTVTGRTEQLLQLTQITWDGDLISKQDRDWLVAQGLAVRNNGFNIITPEGINFLLELKLLHA